MALTCTQFKINVFFDSIDVQFESALLLFANGWFYAFFGKQQVTKFIGPRVLIGPNHYWRINNWFGSRRGWTLCCSKWKQKLHFHGSLPSSIRFSLWRNICACKFLNSSSRESGTTTKFSASRFYCNSISLSLICRLFWSTSCFLRSIVMMDDRVICLSIKNYWINKQMTNCFCR